MVNMELDTHEYINASTITIDARAIGDTKLYNINSHTMRLYMLLMETLQADPATAANGQDSPLKCKDQVSFVNSDGSLNARRQLRTFFHSLSPLTLTRISSFGKFDSNPFL